MTPLALIVVAAVVALAIAGALSAQPATRSPIGEALANDPHPRTVVHAEADEWV